MYERLHLLYITISRATFTLVRFNRGEYFPKPGDFPSNFQRKVKHVMLIALAKVSKPTAKNMIQGIFGFQSGCLNLAIDSLRSSKDVGELGVLKFNIKIHLSDQTAGNNHPDQLGLVNFSELKFPG